MSDETTCKPEEENTLWQNFALAGFAGYYVNEPDYDAHPLVIVHPDYQLKNEL